MFFVYIEIEIELKFCYYLNITNLNFTKLWYFGTVSKMLRFITIFGL